MNQAAGEAGVYGAQSQYNQQQAANTAGMFSGIGAGVGSLAGALSRGSAGPNINPYGSGSDQGMSQAQWAAAPSVDSVSGTNYEGPVNLGYAHGGNVGYSGSNMPANPGGSGASWQPTYANGGQVQHFEQGGMTEEQKQKARDSMVNFGTPHTPAWLYNGAKAIGLDPAALGMMAPIGGSTQRVPVMEAPAPREDYPTILPNPEESPSPSSTPGMANGGEVSTLGMYSYADGGQVQDAGDDDDNNIGKLAALAVQKAQADKIKAMQAGIGNQNRSMPQMPKMGAAGMPAPQASPAMPTQQPVNSALLNSLRQSPNPAMAPAQGYARGGNVQAMDNSKSQSSALYSPNSQAPMSSSQHMMINALLNKMAMNGNAGLGITVPADHFANMFASLPSNEVNSYAEGGYIAPNPYSPGVAPLTHYSNGGQAQWDFRSGGPVPGKAPVKGDSPANDIVKAKLSPGEIVIPRSKVNASDDDILNFVHSVRNKKTR